MAKTPDDRLLTCEEVAKLFRVNTKTVSRWAKDGRFPRSVRIVTPGGHNRFWESKIHTLLHSGEMHTGE